MEVAVHEEDKLATDDDIEPLPLISLHAIAGLRTRDTMQVIAQLCHVTVTALLDSGSTHNFVSEAVAAHTGLCFIPRIDLAVTVANGDRVRCPGVFRNAAFSIDGEPFRADVYVLPLGGHGMVLGTDWLATLGPILWDFGRHTMSLWRSNRRVRWRGVPGTGSAQLHTVHARDLLDLLLDEFADVFATPVGLPPPRSRDHPSPAEYSARGRLPLQISSAAEGRTGTSMSRHGGSGPPPPQFLAIFGSSSPCQEGR